jgi:hypothetical protein
MSDHDVLALVIIGGFVLQSAGLVILGAMLRNSQQLTRAVAGLVYQETAKVLAKLETVR